MAATTSDLGARAVVAPAPKLARARARKRAHDPDAAAPVGQALPSTFPATSEFGASAAAFGALLVPPIITQKSAIAYGLSSRKFLALVRDCSVPHYLLGRLVIVRTDVLLSVLARHEVTVGRPSNDTRVALTGDAAMDAVLAEVGYRRAGGGR